ncbi:MAG: hypothetical protein WA728_29215 [Xanthobacteraceae bacterium]
MTRRVFSSGGLAPGGQPKLVATVWASKDADLGVITGYRHDSDQVHFGSTTAIR